jgi:hypothetical protein
MRKLLFIAIVFVSCNRTKEHHYTAAQQDTIRLASFFRLNEKEAYDFINNYYLLRLDTLGTKRKIFIHPLKSRDVLGDYLKKINNPPIKGPVMISPDFGTDSTFSWDQSKLKSAHIVSDRELADLGKYNTNSHDSLYAVKWRQKFGFGYTCISYPMYNPYTKRMVIYEWLENNFFCGNGRDHKFWYKKTGDKWVKI